MKRKRIFSALTAFALVISMIIPVSAVQNIGALPVVNNQKSIIGIAFDEASLGELEFTVDETNRLVGGIDVPIGTSKETLDLPSRVKVRTIAVLADGEAYEADEEIFVAWKEEGVYDANKAGVYAFVASIDGYNYEGELPKVEVTVEAPIPTEEPAGTEEPEAADELEVTDESEVTNQPEVTPEISIMPESTEAPMRTTFGGISLFESKTELTTDDGYLLEFTVDKIHDGTPSFDSDDTVGNDSRSDNGIIRTFDSVTYDLAYRTAVYTEGNSYERAYIEVEFVLPLSEEEAEWNASDMSAWLSDVKVYKNVDVTYDFDGDGDPETVKCQVLRANSLIPKNDDTNSCIPNGAGTFYAELNIKAMRNGDEVQPVFTAWIKNNQTGNELLGEEVGGNFVPATGVTAPCGHAEHQYKLENPDTSEHREARSVEQIEVQADKIKVTAEPRYNVQIRTARASAYVADRYDFGTGFIASQVIGNPARHLPLDWIDPTSGNPRQKVLGRISCYGVTLQLYNHPGRNDLKGIELPQGNITFDLELSTSFVPENGTPALTSTQQAYVESNYAPLIYSYGEHNSNPQDGRPLGENLYYADGAAPFNRGMMMPSANGSERCYQGGGWNAQEVSPVPRKLSITVSDYEINTNLFPNANTQGNVGANIYFTPTDDGGVKGIGCFSAGVFYVLTPFEYNGTDDSKVGKPLLEDLKAEFPETDIKDGTFKTVLKGINLRATSVSGQPLAEVTDNTNQSNQSDDAAEANVYLSRPGTWQSKIAWSNPNVNPGWIPRDVLGRTEEDEGSWAFNGFDTLVADSPLSVGVGMRRQEDGYRQNRLVAMNAIAKFDADVIELDRNGTIRTNGGISSGYNRAYKVLYGVKPDGSNWVDDTEMNQYRIENLQWYSSIDALEASAPGGKQCVAVLVELRPLTTADKVTVPPGGTSDAITTVPGKVKDDAEANKVYKTVVGVEWWQLSDYDDDKTPPSMVDNTPVPFDSDNVPGVETHWPGRELQPTTTAYRTYNKTVYNADGTTTAGHTGQNYYGDSLHIVDTLTKIEKSVAQTVSSGGSNRTPKTSYLLDNGENWVDFVLTPSFEAMPAGLSLKRTVRIVDTLPHNLYYEEGTSYLGGTYTMNPNPDNAGLPGTVTDGQQIEPQVVTKNVGLSTEHQELTWVLPDWDTSVPIPKIHFNTRISDFAQHRDEFNNMVTIQSLQVDEHGQEIADGRPFAFSTGNKAQAGFVVAKLLATSLSKTVAQKYYDIGDYMNFNVEVANNGVNDIPKTLIIDTLPHNGDAKRSAFDGPLEITSVDFSDSSMPNLDAEWTYYYTTSPYAVDTTANDYSYDDVVDNKESSLPAGTVTWQEVTLNNGKLDLSGIEDITALAMAGNFINKKTIKMDMEIYAKDAKPNSEFANEISMVKARSTARCFIVDRRLSGLTWEDSDHDGLRDNDEKLLNGIKVQLMMLDENTGEYVDVEDKDGNPIFVETSEMPSSTPFTFVSKNNKDEDVDIVITAKAFDENSIATIGAYQFSGLPSGTFAVRFESGTTQLIKYTASPPNVDGTGYIDSDGIPVLDGDGKLMHTVIENIIMPLTKDCTSAVYDSRFHDSGFYMNEGSITLIKKDDKGNRLKGVTFKIEKKDENGDWQELTMPADTTDEDGELVYNELVPGEYRIRETSTTIGHSLLAEPIIVTLPYMVDKGTPGLSDPSYTLDGKDYYLDLTFTIENGMVFTQPLTGSRGSIPFVVSGGLLLAMVADWWLSQLNVKGAKARKRSKAMKG